MAFSTDIKSEDRYLEGISEIHLVPSPAASRRISKLSFMQLQHVLYEGDPQVTRQKISSGIHLLSFNLARQFRMTLLILLITLAQWSEKIKISIE